MHVDDLQELGRALVLEQGGAFHGKVGCIDLQDEVARNQRVFLGDLAGQGEDIGLVAVVVRVQQGGGDDAGRRRRHERLDGLAGLSGECSLEQAAFLLRRTEIVIDDVASRLRLVDRLLRKGCPMQKINC